MREPITAASQTGRSSEDCNHRNSLSKTLKPGGAQTAPVSHKNIPGGGRAQEPGTKASHGLMSLRVGEEGEEGWAWKSTGY